MWWLRLHGGVVDIFVIIKRHETRVNTCTTGTGEWTGESVVRLVGSGQDCIHCVFSSDLNMSPSEREGGGGTSGGEFLPFANFSRFFSSETTSL